MQKTIENTEKIKVLNENEYETKVEESGKTQEEVI